MINHDEAKRLAEHIVLAVSDLAVLCKRLTALGGDVSILNYDNGDVRVECKLVTSVPLAKSKGI